MRKTGIIIILVGLGALLLIFVLNKPLMNKFRTASQQTTSSNEAIVAAQKEVRELIDAGHLKEALEINIDSSVMAERFPAVTCQPADDCVDLFLCPALALHLLHVQRIDTGKE